MKRMYVIECDTEHWSAFVYELTSRTFDMGSGKPEEERYLYSRPFGTEALFNHQPGPKFYGKLHPLLITKDTLEKAQPIEPEPPANGSPHDPGQRGGTIGSRTSPRESGSITPRTARREMAQNNWVIFHKNGTYFRCMTEIGPCFGAKLEEAERMTEEQANHLVSSSWKFCGAEARSLTPGSPLHTPDSEAENGGKP